jgi:hypothetical protein
MYCSIPKWLYLRFRRHMLGAVEQVHEGRLDFLGQFPLRFREDPPEPDEIRWENMDVSGRRRRSAHFVGAALITALLFLCWDAGGLYVRQLRPPELQTTRPRRTWIVGTRRRALDGAYV